MSRRPSPSFRHSMPPIHFAICTLSLAALAFAAPVYADTRLQLSRGLASKHDKGIAAPVARDDSALDVPLRLEYELTEHIVRMTGTTRELRAVIEAMPGPSLPPGATAPPPPVQYASPLEETLARLNHVEQLIADITRIIEDMPFVGNIASAKAAAPRGPAMPRPAPEPKPTPAPAPAPDTQVIKRIRTVALIIGGLIATVLAIYLRRWFMSKRPTRKELAAAIKLPTAQDEALELADIMISIGLADSAAKTLVEHIRANPRQALWHWLKLLDVYRQVNKRTEFENAAENMHTVFNVRPEKWMGKESNSAREASLEIYPHITAQLQELWPTPECGEYLLSLLADNREGSRAGFPLAVVEEIVMLLAVLNLQNQDNPPQ